MSSLAQILIRCDGSARLGMGHVMRCIALAEAFRDEGLTVAFACRELPGGRLDLIVDRSFAVYKLVADDFAQDAVATWVLAEALGARALLVDLSHLDTLTCRNGFVEFLASLAANGLRIAVIDGMGEECVSLSSSLPVDAVIVPYFGADKRVYKLGARSRLFAGVAYFPLRTEFRRVSRQAKEVPEQATRILVAIGGGDVAALNCRVVEALAMLARDNLIVKVIGSINGAEWLPMPIEVIPYSEKMPDLIAWADCAIIGSGLTRYETSYVGTPAIVFSLNSEHARMVDEFAASGAVVSGGVFSDISEATMAMAMAALFDDRNLRSSMTAIGPAVIDGNGAARLASQLLHIFGEG